MTKAPATRDLLVDIAARVDGIRHRNAKAFALATAAQRLFEQLLIVPDVDEMGEQIEQLAHLIDATIDAVRYARADADLLADDLAHRDSDLRRCKTGRAVILPDM